MDERDEEFAAENKLLTSQLDLAASVTVSVAATQCLQLCAVHDAVLTARRYPEVYVGTGGSLSRVEMIRFAERSVVLDLAFRLSVPEVTVWSQFHDADMLIGNLPRIWAEFRSGRVSMANIRTVVDVARSVPDDPRLLDDLDAALVGKAQVLTPSKFRAAARATRERVHPVDPVERNATARQRRHTVFEPADDGMAWFHLYTDAPSVSKIDARLSAAATRQRSVPGEERTMAQLTADAAADVLTGAGTAAEVATHVQVAIPVTALLEKPDVLAKSRLSPAILDGYGPVDEATARAMVADSTSFRRVFTDPISGVDLNMDRRTYRPTAAQREWLRRKHGTCITPTCSRSAARSDVDHTTDWQFDGLTNDDNLAPISRGHHTLKHKTKLRVRQKPDGRYQWITPTGFARDNDPPPF